MATRNPRGGKPAPHVHGKSAASLVGRSRPTENRDDNASINKRVQHWVNLLKDCENTHIGSYEAKSDVLVSMIQSVKSGGDYPETAEEVVRRVPSTISLNLAFKKLGYK